MRVDSWFILIWYIVMVLLPIWVTSGNAQEVKEMVEPFDDHPPYVGVVVVAIEPGSIANQSGLRVGDIVTHVDDVVLLTEDTIWPMRGTGEAFEREIRLYREGEGWLEVNVGVGEIGAELDTHWELKRWYLEHGDSDQAWDDLIFRALDVTDLDPVEGQRLLAAAVKAGYPGGGMGHLLRYDQGVALGQWDQALDELQDLPPLSPDTPWGLSEWRARTMVLRKLARDPSFDYEQRWPGAAQRNTFPAVLIDRVRNTEKVLPEIRSKDWVDLKDIISYEPKEGRFYDLMFDKYPVVYDLKPDQWFSNNVIFDHGVGDIHASFDVTVLPLWDEPSEYAQCLQLFLFDRKHGKNAEAGRLLELWVEHAFWVGQDVTGVRWTALGEMEHLFQVSSGFVKADGEQRIRMDVIRYDQLGEIWINGRRMVCVDLGPLVEHVGVAIKVARISASVHGWSVKGTRTPWSRSPLKRLY